MTRKTRIEISSECKVQTGMAVLNLRHGVGDAAFPPAEVLLVGLHPRVPETVLGRVAAVESLLLSQV